MLWVFYALRNVPHQLWRAFLFRFTTTITIYNDNPQFVWLKKMLAETTYINNHCQRFHVSFVDLDEKRTSFLSLGSGMHYFFYKKKFIALEYKVEHQQMGGNGPYSLNKLNESMVIRILTRKKAFAEELLESANLTKPKAKKINIWTWVGYWDHVTNKELRHLDSLIMDPAEKKAMVDDVLEFYNTRDWYVDRSVPYKRGYLLTGSPGTGKSSTALAIASKLQKPIYMLNLNSMTSDQELEEAFRSVGRDAIMLIEDIDASNVQVKRKKNGSKDKSNKISLSALLNVIDGVAAPEGVLLFITTNYPERVDKALIRPGRIDKIIDFKPLTPKLAQDMFKHFYRELGEGIDITQTMREIKDPVTPAALQMIFLNNKFSPENIIPDLKRLHETGELVIKTKKPKPFKRHTPHHRALRPAHGQNDTAIY